MLPWAFSPLKVLCTGPGALGGVGLRGARRCAAAFLVSPEGVAVWAVAGAGACRVAPEGVAVWALAWARVPFGGSAAPRSCVVPALAPVTAPKSCRWCRVGRRCLQTPCGSYSPTPKGWSVEPVVRLAAPPRGVGLSVRGGPSVALPKKGWWVLGGRAAGGCRLSEEGRRCRLPPWVRPPKGLGSLWPPMVLRAFWGKPHLVRFAVGRRPSEEG